MHISYPSICILVNIPRLEKMHRKIHLQMQTGSNFSPIPSGKENCWGRRSVAGSYLIDIKNLGLSVLSTLVLGLQNCGNISHFVL